MGEYRYTDDLLGLHRLVPSVVSLPPVCSYITTPLRLGVWRRHLWMFPDSNFVTYLLNGIQYGFCIGCHSSSNLRSAASNMKGALDHATVVEKYLHEERAAGRIVSVLSEYHSNMHVSRFGVIPKRHQPGEWRLIVDLSAPEGRSVNDFIDASLCSLMYASVDDVADFVLTAGQGTLLAKLDIKHAYRNIPIHPLDRHLLGMWWRDDVIIDTCLPFGLR